jgi:hypothetical protein
MKKIVDAHQGRLETSGTTPTKELLFDKALFVRWD